jgi:hypothetical protein
MGERELLLRGSPTGSQASFYLRLRVTTGPQSRGNDNGWLRAVQLDTLHSGSLHPAACIRLLWPQRGRSNCQATYRQCEKTSANCMYHYAGRFSFVRALSNRQQPQSLWLSIRKQSFCWKAKWKPSGKLCRSSGRSANLPSTLIFLSVVSMATFYVTLQS